MQNFNRPNVKRAYISELISALENKSPIRISLQYNNGYCYKVEVFNEDEREQFPIPINETTYEIVSKLLSPNTPLRKYGKWSFNRLRCTENSVEIKRMPRIKLLAKKEPVSNQSVVII